MYTGSVGEEGEKMDEGKMRIMESMRREKGKDVRREERRGGRGRQERREGGDGRG